MASPRDADPLVFGDDLPRLPWDQHSVGAQATSEQLLDSGCPCPAALNTWFADVLHAERAAVLVMLERRHEKVLHELANLRCGGEEEKDKAVSESTTKGGGGSLTQVPSTVRYEDGGASSNGQLVASEEAVELKHVELQDAVPVAIQQGEAVPRTSDAEQSTRPSASQEKVAEAKAETRLHADDIVKLIASIEHRAFTGLQHCEKNWRWRAEKNVVPIIELIVTFVILVNAITMAAEQQYKSFDIAHLHFSRSRSSKDTWPEADTVFASTEWAVGIIFSAEMLLKVVVLHKRYITSGWNIFDSMVVLSWIVLQASIGVPMINPTLLRVVKLIRVSRVLRLVRVMPWLGSLHLLVTSVSSSISVLFWSLCLILLVIVVASLVVGELLRAWIVDESNVIGDRLKIFADWGSFSRSLVTMFEITVGNWGPPCRLLQNLVSEWWVMFVISYKCIIGFAVVQVITSVFIQQTFKTAANDEEVMIIEKKASSEAVIKNLEKLFAVIDNSGDGLISREEFQVCLEDSRVLTWFAALDLDSTTVSNLFDIIDIGCRGAVGHDEFIHGVRSLKGTARSADLLAVAKRIGRIERILKEGLPTDMTYR